MKEKLALAFFLFFSCSWLCAQSVSKTAVTPQGAVSEMDDMSLEWTIGEVFVHTVEHQNGILTQGSQQPMLLIESVEMRNDEDTYTGINIQVYPNPVEAIIKIDIDATESKDLNIALVDAGGKSLINAASNTDTNHLELDISTFTPGVYYLFFNDDNGETVETFKVVKM